MAAKYQLFAVLAIFAFQTLNAQTTSGPIEDPIQNAVLKTKEAIQDVFEALKAFGNKAVATINALLNGLKNTAKEVITKAQQKIAQFKASIEAGIQKSIKLAAAAGADVRECVVAEKSAVVHLVENTTLEVIGCVTNQIAKGEATVGSVDEAVNRGLDTIEKTVRTIGTCVLLGEPLKVIACLAKIVVSDIVEAIRFQSTITEDMLKAVKQAAEIRFELPICLAGKIVGIEVPAASIVKDFDVCVLDKISGL